LAEAHLELGYVRMIGGRDLRSAEAELQRAAALDPGSAAAHENLSIVSIWLGRPAGALAEARLAMEADPLSAGAILSLARALYANGRYDEALEQLRSIASLRPPVRLYYQMAGLCYVGKERWPEAIATFRQGVELGTADARAWLGFALARSGARQEAARLLADLRAQWRRRVRGAYDIAVVYAGLDDRDHAFVWFNRAADQHQLIWQIMGPAFEELRRDPRFEHVRRRLGLQSQ
jgi:tetratricopeptide (TPR) repeat protein